MLTDFQDKGLTTVAVEVGALRHFLPCSIYSLKTAWPLATKPTIRQLLDDTAKVVHIMKKPGTQTPYFNLMTYLLLIFVVALARPSTTSLEPCVIRYYTVYNMGGGGGSILV